MRAPKIKKGDTVVVIAGRDKGKQGKVLRVYPQDGRALVENINKIKKHTKPNPQQQIQGGIVERDAPIHLSNLMLIDPDSGKPTRIGRQRMEDGKPARVAKISGSVIG